LKLVTCLVKHRYIPHQIIKIGTITRHTAPGEKYWTVERGTHVFQVGFLREEDALQLATKINSEGARLNPDLWKDKMPKVLR
jgi:hypothetical protein